MIIICVVTVTLVLLLVKLGRGDVWTSDVRCHLTTKTHTTKSRKASVCCRTASSRDRTRKRSKESCQSRIAPGPYFPRVHSRYGGIALRKKGEISIWHKLSVRKHWNLLANDKLETVQWQWSEFVVKSELHSVTRVALRVTIRCVVILALSLLREARRHVKTSVARSHQSTMKHTTGHRKGQGHVWISVPRNHHSTKKQHHKTQEREGSRLVFFRPDNTRQCTCHEFAANAQSIPGIEEQKLCRYPVALEWIPCQDHAQQSDSCWSSDLRPSEEYEVGPKRTIEVVELRELTGDQTKFMGRRQSRERRKESSGPLEHRMQKII